MWTRDREAGRSSYRLVISIVGVVVALGLLPAVAAAQSDPTEAQYGSTLDQISQGGGGGQPSSAGSGGDASHPSSVPGGVASSTASDRVVGGLPFTGLDVGLLAAVAIALAGAGMVLYRRSREVPGDSTP